MSTFIKTPVSRSNINGTKLKNYVAHISTGIPSLDFVIGGGVPVGSIFTIEEDVLGSYSRVLTKYFLAEGVVCEHDIFIASADENPELILQELPQPCTISDNDDSKKTSSDMKIAWRYEGLGQVESSFGSNSNFGHHFDLSKHIDPDTINKRNITCLNLFGEPCAVNVFKNSLYYKLLTNIKNVISKDEYKIHGTNKNILRVVIQSLGSPIWMANGYDEELQNNNFGSDLLKFIYCLRVMIRKTNTVVFITTPAHLFQEEHLMDRFLYSVDNAVRLESFAGSDKETNPVFNEYHGLLHITKLSAVHSLVPYVPPSLDLAFKLKRKKFVVEKLHLPPELQESSEREQDDITAGPKTCGDFKKMNIDF